MCIRDRNTLVNVFSLARNEVYSLIEKYSVTHISATPDVYKRQGLQSAGPENLPSAHKMADCVT